MSIFFVEENDKLSIFDIRKVIIQKEKIIINRNMSRINIKQKMKIVNKIRDTLLKYKCKRIVLTEELKKDKEFNNLLATNNISIINGKWLFKMLIPEIVDDIVKKNNLKKEEIELIFTVNEKSRIVEEYIELFARELKRVGVVTNHLSQFKKVEDKLYNNNGILITVTNNKRKSLLKADVILNIDYPKEILNKFTLNDNAIIINIEGDMKILKKRFCGKLMNDYEIEVKDDLKFNQWLINNQIEIKKYNTKDVYEGYCYIYGLNKEKISIK